MDVSVGPPHLLNLPNELLINIMRHVEPEDILSLRATCIHIRGITKGSKIAFKENLRAYMVSTGRTFHHEPSGIGYRKGTHLKAHYCVRVSFWRDCRKTGCKIFGSLSFEATLHWPILVLIEGAKKC
jgi:hypothetical protein